MSDVTDIKSKEKRKRPRIWSRGFRRSKSKAKSEASKSSTTTANPVESNSNISGIPVFRVVEGQVGVELNPYVQASESLAKEKKKKQMEDQKLLAEAEFVAEIEDEK